MILVLVESVTASFLRGKIFQRVDMMANFTFEAVPNNIIDIICRTGLMKISAVKTAVWVNAFVGKGI